VQELSALLAAYHPLLEAVTAAGSLLAVVTWLIAIPVILHNWWRGKAIRLEFNLMGVRAAALFGGAAEQWASRAPSSHPKAKTAIIARTLERAFDAQGRSRLVGRRILWVDDNPSSIVLEVQGFEALGAVVIERQDTEAALKVLSEERFDLVVSDMGRPPDMRAGYTLLGKMRQQGIKTPFLIYSSEKRPEHVQEATKLGAQGTTNDPEELLAMALSLV
jgi:CheY-like chemotaxis protein